MHTGRFIGTHVGGYDAIELPIPEDLLWLHGNELVVKVYDPGDEGHQPNGKQRISALSDPSGDTYSPSTGIWQTVWIETVPKGPSISRISLQTTIDMIQVTVYPANATDMGRMATATLFLDTSYNEATSKEASISKMGASDGTERVMKLRHRIGDGSFEFAIDKPRLWSPDDPFLYRITVTLDGSGDTVTTYAGMRVYSKCLQSVNGTEVMKLCLNGKPLFLAGWLDQSWWPDGQYTAPTDDALRFDLQAVKDFGLNFVRLHQKVNSERWYYHADRLGVIVWQDMIQKVED